MHSPTHSLTHSLTFAALRREATIIRHEDFNEAINEVAAKKKGVLDYYA